MSLLSWGLKPEYLLINWHEWIQTLICLLVLFILISPCSWVAPDGTAPLHKLGNESWAKTRQKAAEKFVMWQLNYFDVYAQREVKKALSFKYDREGISAIHCNLSF